ncbi:MAG: LUD domain-containing protein [Deltaproteobacteria bacterium]|jgi:iron-sulfur cluster protein|nr:LUD domain-containing protein [Deltaproteobacteria bacterium]
MAEESRAEYRERLKRLLADKHLRSALDRFARQYPPARRAAYGGADPAAAAAGLARAKDEAIPRLMELYEAFREKAEAKGAKVYLARDAAECRRLVLAAAREAGATRIVKSKSMTCEEIRLNEALAAEGLEVRETDLGEWIVQLRGEPPSHMVLPAIHLDRWRVDESFARETGISSGGDIQALVRLARSALRRDFAEAGLAVTGANFAVASLGALGILSNEGNARLAATLPAAHVAVVGLDKLVPDLAAAAGILKVLPRNATGQPMAAYLSLVAGAAPCPLSPGGVKDFRVIFLDNGRLAAAADPAVREILRCVRCGACANVCPVYRMVGGHGLGRVYIGAVGIALACLLEGPASARNIAFNCLGCGACREVCAAAIDLPLVIEEVRARAFRSEGFHLDQGLIAAILSRRSLMAAVLKAAAAAQGPLVRDGMVRHLPFVLSGDGSFRSLPALARKPFRTLWQELCRGEAMPEEGRVQGAQDPPAEEEAARAAQGASAEEEAAQGARGAADGGTGAQASSAGQAAGAHETAAAAGQARWSRSSGPKVALFAGCAHEFVYPEDLLCGIRLFRAKGAVVSFPESQGCCGLPARSLGWRAAALRTAAVNAKAFDCGGADHVVSLCASCASHLKFRVPLLLAEDKGLSAKAASLAERVMDFSAFLANVLGYGPDDFERTGERAAFHGACHQSRGLGAVREPRMLLASAAEYAATDEEDVCCGFGGAYSLKFPETSAAVMERKLRGLEGAGAHAVVTDCPGCVMQLGGGLDRRGRPMRAEHMARFLAGRLKLRG